MGVVAVIFKSDGPFISLVSCTFLSKPLQCAFAYLFFSLVFIVIVYITQVLTPLGVHLASLPVDCRLGKLLLLGAVFGCADEALTIAATLSQRSPFLCPPDKRVEADVAKMSFASHNR